MPRHERFEKLCSLAALGEVTPEEVIELHDHLRGCAKCRVALADFSSIIDDRLPLADPGRARGSPEVDSNDLSKLRELTLRRVAGEGLHVSQDAFLGPNPRLPKLREWLNEFSWSVRARLPRIAASAAVLAMVVIGTALLHRDRQQKEEAERLRKELRLAQETSATVALQPRELPHSDLTPEIAQLQKELSVAKENSAALKDEHRNDVDAIQKLESQIAQLVSDKTVLAQQKGSVDTELAKLRQDLDQLRTAASNRDAQLVAQQYRITELSKEMESQKDAIDHERELLAAGRDVRDLMTARNLHIIDVHDQNARGESQPFGRIFLTEGKRLIFYAYDLDTAQVKNASFQAWGQRTDGGKSAVNLGIFYIDDQKQSRWALKVENPDLLKTIDSVFVTVELSGGTKKPSGKKLMYAYLHNPINHP